MNKYKRYTITAALPYANGPIHIGHLAGVYVPADIYARYLRLKNIDVIYICGSDEHGVPITLKAKQEGVNPQLIVDRYHYLNKESFEKFGISFDIYSRTSNKIHHETSSEIFKTIYENKVFIEKTTDQYYDEEANQFLADRYITGTCPHCGNTSAYGDQCEKCGTSLSPTDLIQPKSTISGTEPVMKKTKHWYLPLDRYQDFFEKWILEEHKEWKTNVYGQCKSWLDQGLQARAVSRDLEWGVKVPLKEAEGKVLYVWFDAPIGYISATKELTNDWEKYWKDKETRLIHFIGKDNIVFHCIVFPAILHAEGNYILPDNVPANEFLNLEGDKISTSRNWAVWLHEYLEEFKDKQDVLRYVLCANMPETKDNDFTWKDFQNRNNNELVAILGNFINRALVLTHKYFNGIIPEISEITDFDNETLNELVSYKEKVEFALDNFRFRDALKEAMNMARLGNKYLADTEPWILIKENENRVKTILNIAIQITANLSIILEPFLPNSAEKIKKFINIDTLGWDKIAYSDNIPAGHQINKPKLLFDKIEDKDIEYQINKLMQTKKDNNDENVIIPDQKESINYEEFMKNDLRVGTILEAEKVPKTTKLLKLVIDTGIDKRTVVSGIAEYFKPQEIIGKQVCILVNLEPRKLRGIESKGMILMAEDPDGKLIFVSPADETINGSEIK